MPIEAVLNTPGLWRAANWKQGDAGLYAVVIGVSRYRHMKGGDAPATETYGFEQLISSATTAASVFEWLQRRYQRENLPLVWCYLLLAPQDDERPAVDEITNRHYAEPTFRAINDAVDAWTTALPEKAPECTKSRTFFFFSGHGVQACQEPLMLPADYLRPSAKALQECASVHELRQWMETHCVAEHFALIDACRNEFEPLAKKKRPAATVFPESDSLAGSITAATLQATSANRVAYQLRGEPMTCFGTALLEGLTGSARDSASSDIEFNSLVAYVGPRVNQLLVREDNNLDQPVKPWIAGGRPPLVVTELAASAPLRTAPTSPTTPPPPPDADPRFKIARSARPTHSLRELRDSFALAHEVMGHEYATAVLQSSLQVVSLEDDTELGTLVRRSQRNEDSSLVELELTIEHPSPREGAVVATRSPETPNRAFFAVIPAAGPPHDWHRISVRARLALDTTGPTTVKNLETRVGRGSVVWLVGEAMRLADLGMLQSAVRLVQRNPFRLFEPEDIESAATIAALLVLVRANALDTMKSMDAVAALERLPKYPKAMSDAAVLWAWAIREKVRHNAELRIGGDNPIASAAEALLQIRQRGMPFFTHTLALLPELVRWLRREPTIEKETKHKLNALLDRVEYTMSYANADGHFLTYVSTESRPLTIEKVRALHRLEVEPDDEWNAPL